MKAFDYLEHIRQLKREISIIETELDIIERETFSAPAIQYDREKISTTPSKDMLENMVIEHIGRTEGLTKELLEHKNEYISCMDEALRYIRKMDSDDQQEVLILRYINNKKWDEILRYRGCDDIRSQYRLHERALESLQNILDNI